MPESGPDSAARALPSASWAEVDLAAIRHNLHQIRSLVGPACGVWAVVKADAYGHGAVPVARAAAEAGAAGLAVSSLGEAAELRESGLEAPILLLGSGNCNWAEAAVRLDLIQTACDPDIVRLISRAAEELGKTARVHLKIDTGMGRFGVAPEDAASFAETLLSLPGLRLEGVFSHLATAEDADPSYALLQFGRYQASLQALSASSVDPGIRHLANSAAALRFPDMRLDAVRTGLAIYGIRPDAPDLPPLDLRPALTWKTRVAFTQRVPAGSSISYGRTYVTKQDTLVAVLPVGYADGYPRHASNRAQVLLRGTACRVIGVVCMDHLMVDATATGEPRVGDEVTLLGRQGNAQISANQLAQWAGTVVHAVPTLIGQRVRRHHLDGEKRSGSGAGTER